MENMSEVKGIAFIYKGKGDRWELKIDNTLKGYTQGDNEAEHEIGKAKLRLLAEEKGYTVYES
jgi:hypothetical protein